MPALRGRGRQPSAWTGPGSSPGAVKDRWWRRTTRRPAPRSRPARAPQSTDCWCRPTTATPGTAARPRPRDPRWLTEAAEVWASGLMRDESVRLSPTRSDNPGLDRAELAGVTARRRSGAPRLRNRSNHRPGDRTLACRGDARRVLGEGTGPVAGLWWLPVAQPGGDLRLGELDRHLACRHVDAHHVAVAQRRQRSSEGGLGDDVG